MTKVKVLHIIKSLGRGGAEMLLPETLQLHNQELFEFQYIYFLPWKDQMVSALESNGAKVTCISASNNLWILAKRAEVINYIKNNQIDIVHCHLPWAGFLGRLVYQKIKVPTLYSEHNKQERYHRVTRVLNRLTFNWQTRAIAVSKNVEESIRVNIKPKIPVETLLNGVNSVKYNRDFIETDIRKRFNIPEDAIVIGIVAVFRFQKRLNEWLEVIAEICQQRENVYGIIVGDGPLKKEIEAKHKELGLKDRVSFAGLQTEVRPYYKAMDIFMMTSEFEGLPIALLEAMSMKCAIFSTDAGGVKEVINDPKSGISVPVQSWRELADLVLFHIDHHSLNGLGENARVRVNQEFSMESMVEKLEKVYQSIA